MNEELLIYEAIIDDGAGHAAVYMTGPEHATLWVRCGEELVYAETSYSRLLEAIFNADEAGVTPWHTVALREYDYYAARRTLNQ